MTSGAALNSRFRGDKPSLEGALPRIPTRFNNVSIKVDIRNGSFSQLRQLIQEGGRIRSAKQDGEFVVYARLKRSSNLLNRFVDHCMGNTRTKREHVLEAVKVLCARHEIDFEKEMRNCGMSPYELNKVLAGKGDLKSGQLKVALARFVEVDDKVFTIDMNRRLGAGGNAEVYEAHHGDECIAMRRVLQPANQSHKALAQWDTANAGLRREVNAHAIAARKSVGDKRSFVLPTYEEVVVSGDGTFYQAMSLAVGSGARAIEKARTADHVAMLFSRRNAEPLTAPQTQRIKEHRKPLTQRFLDRQARKPDVRLTVSDWTLAVERVGHRGLAHRDIKPENFLLDVDGHFQISDFGTAGTANSLFQATPGGQNVLLTGNVNDCAKSPEWLRSEDINSNARFAVGEKDDGFSLGVAVWQRLSGGRFPFDGTEAEPDKALNGYAYMENVLAYADSGKSFSEWYENRHPGLLIPQEWKSFLDSSLHSDPNQRASAGQLKDLVPRFDGYEAVDEATVRRTMLEKMRRGRT
jgi:serine/threonine protein kinase